MVEAGVEVEDASSRAESAIPNADVATNLGARQSSCSGVSGAPLFGHR